MNKKHVQVQKDRRANEKLKSTMSDHKRQQEAREKERPEKRWRVKGSRSEKKR